MLMSLLTIGSPPGSFGKMEEARHQEDQHLEGYEFQPYFLTSREC
jgi:hypothetical protein